MSTIAILKLALISYVIATLIFFVISDCDSPFLATLFVLILFIIVLFLLYSTIWLVGIL